MCDKFKPTTELSKICIYATSQNTPICSLEKRKVCDRMGVEFRAKYIDDKSKDINSELCDIEDSIDFFKTPYFKTNGFEMLEDEHYPFMYPDKSRLDKMRKELNDLEDFLIKRGKISGDNEIIEEDNNDKELLKNAKNDIQKNEIDSKEVDFDLTIDVGEVKGLVFTISKSGDYKIMFSSGYLINNPNLTCSRWNIIMYYNNHKYTIKKVLDVHQDALLDCTIHAKEVRVSREAHLEPPQEIVEDKEK